jgi:hypothetical protein
MNHAPLSRRPRPGNRTPERHAMNRPQAQPTAPPPIQTHVRQFRPIGACDACASEDRAERRREWDELNEPPWDRRAAW